MYKWKTSKHSKVKNVKGLLLWKRFNCNAFKTLSKSRGAGLLFKTFHDFGIH